MGSVFVAAQARATVDGHIKFPRGQTTNAPSALSSPPNNAPFVLHIQLNRENVLTKAFTSSLFLDTAELNPAQASSYQDGHLAGIDNLAQFSQCRLVFSGRLASGHGVN